MSSPVFGPVIPGVCSAAYCHYMTAQMMHRPVCVTAPLPSSRVTERFIYCLALEDNKYYIETSKSISTRLSLHRSRTACAWTSRHTVIDVVEIISANYTSENDVVERYMALYGVDNVRGGSYSSVKLRDRDYKYLRRKIPS